MATTLVIEDQIIEEAQAFSEHKSSLETVIEALKEYTQYRKQLQIISLFGTIDYYEDYDYKEQRKIK